MPLHYTKSGSLDMRYSSSKAAVASSSSYSGGGGGSRSSSGSAGSGYYSASSSLNSSSNSSFGGGSNSGLHYTKDGSLDMRYASSKAAASSSYSSNPSTTYKNPGYSSGNNLHYKKDGSLDMRFSSSQQAMSTAQGAQDLTKSFNQMSLHTKKDGTLDMRYASSKAASASTQSAQKMHVRGIPENIPVTTRGLPDMRTNAAKNWVKMQAKTSQGDCTYLPSWIPRTKDGSVDFSKAVTAEYFKGNGGEALKNSNLYNPNHRQNYYEEKLNQQDLFRRLIEEVRRENIEVKRNPLLSNTREIKREWSRPKNETAYSDLSTLQLLNTVPLINDKDLILTSEQLGRGAFGVVTKGTLKGVEVAVKRLHLQKLSRKEKEDFTKEIKILASLGAHPNLVTLHGYMLDPPTMVMEFVHLGSLNYLLHYNEDPKLEAKMTDGRIKKRLAIGIINGMQQIHGVNIVHGDLKPQNILVSKEFQAKITDFGLATMRGKTSSVMDSTVTADGDVAVGGTAGYMAPELLDHSGPPELSSDVYSFGIVLNEVIQEEEPYSDQFKNFLGRGPFAAANYAKLGNRPKIHSKTPVDLKGLIEKCWSVKPSHRPTFDRICSDIEMVKFPNSF